VCALPLAASQDHYQHRIRRVDIATRVTTNLAGTGTFGFLDGASAHFKYPQGIAIDPSGTFALVGVRPPPLPPHSRL
jgi:hypothetical protein